MRGAAEQLRAAFAASKDVVVFNLPAILRTFGPTGDVLIRRGWEVESIGAEGAGFLWPASWFDESQHYGEMKIPITHLMLWSNLTVEYTLAGARS